MKEILIKNEINTQFAVSPEDGDIIYEKICNYINNKEKISLNFLGLDLITTAFLNNAIGKLYKNLDSYELNKFLTLTNISNSDLNLVKKVINRAKITFSDDYNKIIGDCLNNEQ